MTFEHDTTYTDLNGAHCDSDVSIECGQRPVADSTKPSRSIELDFRLDSIVMDRLDVELCGLPKDLYIGNLKDLCGENEESVSYYRTELSKRARNVNHDKAPVGILKDRRKSSKFPLIDKYALDCYLLQQFLDSNVNDLDELFRKPSVSQSQPFTATRSQSSEKNDLSLLKETVASLQSDVLQLKKRSEETEDNVNSVTRKITTDLESLRSELLETRDVITQNINVYVSSGRDPTLSDGLRSITSAISKLEKSKSGMLDELKALKTSIRDNRANIDGLMDTQATEKRDYKERIKYVRNEIESSLSERLSTCADNSKTDTAIKQLNARLKHCEQTQNKDRSDESRVDKRVSDLAQNMNEKLDAMCYVLETSLCKVVDAVNTLSSKKDSASH